jgi:isoleucyl-tRNA synthetase
MAYWTLHRCLVTLVKLLAPFMPFVTEEMYQNLARSADADAPESVHHCDFPVPDETLVDEKLMTDMGLVVAVSSLGRSARSTSGIKLRQPLRRALVAGPFAGQEKPLGPLADLVLDELNVKELDFVKDTGELVSYVLKPDPGALGPKHGSLFPKIREAVMALEGADAARRVQAGAALEVTVDGKKIELLPQEVAVETVPREGYAVSEEGDYTVAVDVTLTDDLVKEGLARELVRRIQNLRKEADFRIEDKILTYYQGEPLLMDVMREYGVYIAQETLSVKIEEGPGPEGSFGGEFDVGGRDITFHLLTVQAGGASA